MWKIKELYLEKGARMKEKGLLVMVWVAAAVIAVMPVVFGCGGGGSSDPISYEGEEGAYAVAGTTAAAYLTNGYGGIDAASVLAGTMVGPGGGVLGVLSAEAMPQDLPTIIQYEDTIFCGEDGSFDVDFTVNTITLEFTGTIDFNGCSNRPGESVNGNADAEGDGFNMEGPPETTAMTFEDLTIVKWGETWKATGDMTVQNPPSLPMGAAVPLFTADVTVTIEEMILKSPEGLTMKIQGAEIGVDLSGSVYYMTINSGGKGALLYHPDYGYLYISVWDTDPIIVDDETGVPFAGVIRIRDESGGYAWLRFTANGTTYWDVWLDGGNATPDFDTLGEPDDTFVTGGTFDEGDFVIPPPG